MNDKTLLIAIVVAIVSILGIFTLASAGIKPPWITGTGTTVISSCQNINVSGAYSLNQSITNPVSCLNISASNVDLNCSGFNITATQGNQNIGTASIAVNITGNNVSVYSCGLVSALGTDASSGIEAHRGGDAIGIVSIGNGTTVKNSGIYSLGGQNGGSQMISIGSGYGILKNAGTLDVTNVTINSNTGTQLFGSVGISTTVSSYGIYLIGGGDNLILVNVSSANLYGTFDGIGIYNTGANVNISNSTVLTGVNYTTGNMWGIFNSGANVLFSNVSNNNAGLHSLNRSYYFFYSSANISVASQLNLGWFPLLSSLNATSQSTTAYYNGSGGGLNADLSSNISLKYWFNNKPYYVNVTNSSLGSAILYIGDTLKGYCAADSYANVNFTWVLYKNNIPNITGQANNIAANTSVNIVNVTGTNLTSSNYTLKCVAIDIITLNSSLNSSALEILPIFNITDQIYTLNENVPRAILNATGITLDCAGYGVSSASNLSDVNITKNNIVVKNCIIQLGVYGIYAFNVSNATITNNTVYGLSPGVYTNHDIYFLNVTNSSIYNNDLAGVGVGTVCYGSVCISNGDYNAVTLINSSNINLYNLYIHDFGGVGIVSATCCSTWCQSASGLPHALYISNSLFNATNITSYNLGGGYNFRDGCSTYGGPGMDSNPVYIESSSNSVINGLVVNKTYAGQCSPFGGFHTASSGNSYAMILSSSNNITVKNSLVDTVYSTSALSCSTNGVQYSLLLKGGANNSFINLTVTNSTGYGIYTNNSQSNFFYANSNEIGVVANKFYSNVAQDMRSGYNTGWWPLLMSNGTNATTFDQTAFFNGSSGGLNYDGSANAANQYWYSNQTGNINFQTYAILNDTNGTIFTMSRNLTGYLNVSIGNIGTPLSLNGRWFYNGNVFSNITSIGNVPDGVLIQIGNVTNASYGTWVLETTISNGYLSITQNTTAVNVIRLSPTILGYTPNTSTIVSTSPVNLTVYATDPYNDTLIYVFYANNSPSFLNTPLQNSTSNKFNFSMGATGYFYWRADVYESISNASMPATVFSYDNSNVSLYYPFQNQTINTTFLPYPLTFNYTIINTSASVCAYSLYLQNPQIFLTSGTITCGASLSKTLNLTLISQYLLAISSNASGIYASRNVSFTLGGTASNNTTAMNPTLSILNVYLENQSNVVFNYPRINQTFKCAADVIPADNTSITSISWIITSSVAGINSTSTTAVNKLDKQSWETYLNLTPTAEGTVTCVLSALDSKGTYKTFSRIFTVTTALPGCGLYDDSCVLSSGSLGTPTTNTYRYKNISIAPGAVATFATPPLYSTSQVVTMIADNAFDIAGTLSSLPSSTTSAITCHGEKSVSLTLKGRIINLTGIVSTTGNDGNTSCGVCSYSNAGGDAGYIRIYADEFYQTGTIIQKSGNGGTFDSGLGCNATNGGAGGAGGDLQIYANLYQFSGLVNSTTGTGGQAPGSTCAAASGAGGAGGSLTSTPVFSGGTFNFTAGSIYVVAGDGGAGASNTYACGRNGGSGGSLQQPVAIHVERFYNNAYWYIKSGNGGAGNGFVSLNGVGTCSSNPPRAGDAGSAYGVGNSILGSAFFNYSFINNTINEIVGTPSPVQSGVTDCTTGTNGIQSGAAGTARNHTFTYGLGANASSYANFTVNSVFSSYNATVRTAHAGPTGAVAFLFPTNASVVYPVPASNITMNITNTTPYYTQIFYSLDNNTWYLANGNLLLTPTASFPTTSQYDTWFGSYTGESGQTSYSLDLNRILYPRLINLNFVSNSTGTVVYIRARQQYNNMFTSFVYATLNVTPRISSIINVWRTPSDENLTMGTTRFYCQVRDAYTGLPLYTAPVYININGINLSTSYDASQDAYYYQQSAPSSAGLSQWYCIGWKPNYNSIMSSNQTYSYDDWYVDLPLNVNTVRLTCPFPVAYGIVPAGQVAKIGIFRVVNLNTTVPIYVSLAVNQVPTNMTLFQRPNWSNVFNISTGQATDSTPLTTTFATPLSNGTTPSNSSYIWIYANCLNATPGVYNTTYRFNRSY